MPYTFIHTADIHLDAPMDAQLSAQQAAQRRREVLETFLELVNYARERQVTAVLISGDLFDTERISRTTLSAVIDAIESAPSVDFYYLPGNHDEVSAQVLRQVQPANLTVFSDHWESYSYGQVCISGCQLTQKNQTTALSELPLDPSMFNMVMLHGALGGHAGVDTLDKEALVGQGIDYAALGHIHAYQTGRIDARGTWCYSGCLEGRGFDECGQKGFVELTYTAGVLKSQFVPFARRLFFEVPVDISGVEDVLAIAQCAQRAAQDIPSDSLVKFTLTGTYTEDTNKDLAYVKEVLSRQFFFATVVDKTTYLANLLEDTSGTTLKSQFVQTVLASGESPEEKQRIISCGLCVLSGQEIPL